MSARLNCPHCGSDDYRIDTSGAKRAKRHPEVNAVFRLARCRGCGRPFATVEVVVSGPVADHLESLVGGWIH